MAFLLLYVGNDKQFDVGRISEGLLASPRVKPRLGSGEYSFRCEYTTETDFVEVSIRDNARSIALDTTGAAAFAAALDIQKMCDEPIHLVDESYAFDLVLTDYSSPAELERAAAAGWA